MIMNYTEIRAEAEERIGKLSHECGLFWAFSNKQFDENKTPLKGGEKYVSIGAGGYMPKGNINRWLQGMKDFDKWKKSAVKTAKAEQVILYELNNYECFYTGEISDALEVLEPLGYTVEQVKTVYRAHREFALN
jgi:hypothetical protein